MYLSFTILSLNLAYCVCFVSYDIFKGFDFPVTTSTIETTTAGRVNFTTTDHIIIPKTEPVPTSVPTTKPLTDPTEYTQAPVSYTTELVPVTSKFLCPENEQPINIGAYEVPTQRDIVLLVGKTLTRMFNSYHEKALYFLKDIKDATKATVDIERKCHGYGTDKSSFKKCVWQVSNKCEIITKDLVTALEGQRRDVSAFTDGTICDVKGLKADPLNLIKTLAMEEASVEFALPGYLRLLSACAIYCNKMEPRRRPRKPLRHMTDQDLVVKHFLTKKNYIQLIKDST